MRKIKYLGFLLIISFIGVFNVDAASANISVSANTKTVIVGNTIQVTVKVSSSKLGSWEYCISYDSSVLKLTSSTADANTCVKAGVVDKVGQTSSTEKFTFKAIKSGSSNITIKSYAVYDYDTEQQMSTSVGSVKVQTMTQAELEATYSTNAYLKSITVGDYQLTPEFNKETLEYSVEVENEIENVKVSASKADATASITGTGDIALTEGNNKVEIIVTAQKGNTLTYVVNIYRKELDPINVTFDKENYTIVRKSDALIEHPTFTATTITYGEFEIPALYSEITGYTIIGLKDESGNISMYIYDNGKITSKYVEVKSNSLTLYPLELPENEEFANYEKREIEFNGLKVSGYILTEKSKFAVIYAQNIESGDILYYSYNIEDNSVQVYNKEYKEYYEEKITNYKYVLIGFIIFSIFLIFLLIIRKPKATKRKNKSTNEPSKLEVQEIKIEETKENSTTEEKTTKKEKKANKKQKKEKIRNDFDF